MLSGRFPAAELVALDAKLRVLATGRSPVPYGGTLHACGDDVLSHGYDEAGQLVVRRLTLPAFEMIGEYRPDFDPQLATADAQDAVCRGDGTVDVLVLMWPEEPDLQLHRDVFGDLTVTSLPNTVESAFANEHVVFVQPATRDAGPLRLFSYGPDDGQRELLLEHRMEGGTPHVSSDGRHAILSGSDDGPLSLVVELVTGEIVGQQRSDWQPVHRPWLGDDRLLLNDWNSGGIGSGERSRFRVVDLEFDEVATFEDAALGIRAPGVDQAMRSSSHGIEVFDRDHDLVRTRDALWAGAAADGLLLDEIVEDPAAEPLRAAQQVAASDPEPSAAEPPATDPAAPGAGPDPAPPWLPVAGVLLAALVAAAVVRRRAGRRSAE